MKTNHLKKLFIAKTTRVVTLLFYLSGPMGLLGIKQAQADAITDAAISGQNAARDILNGSTTGTISGGNISITNPDGSITTITTNDLYQTQNATQAQQDNFDAASVTYGNEAGLDSASGAYTSTNSTPQDSAYEVMQLGDTRSHPDMTNDPIWTLTDNTMNSLDTLQTAFADCSASTTYVNTQTTERLPDLRTCDRVYVPQSACTINHLYDAELLRLTQDASSAGAYASCGPGCYDLWVGKVGDNYWGGICTIYEQSTSIKVMHPEAIISARLVRAKFDDYMQIYVSGNKIYNGPNANFPPETAGACELATNWDLNPNIDVTNIFTSTPAGGDLQFKTRVSVTGNGEGYSRIRINYDVSKIVINDVWDPIQCANDYNAANGSAFCTGATANCTLQTNTGTYTNANGITFDTNSLAPSPISSISNLCQQVAVTTQCDYSTGNLPCYTDMFGVVQCPTSATTNSNGCAAYESDPTCAFVSSACVEGAFDTNTGTCMVTEDVYDCGYDVAIPTQVAVEDYVCPGPVRCMGTECTLDTQESNMDFAQTAATLEAIKFMAMDQVCDVTAASGGGPGTDCTIFTGDSAQCKKAVGGTVDCCEKPAGVSMSDYLTLLYAVYSLDQAAGGIGTGYVLGAWQDLSNVAGQTWNTISAGAESLWTSASDAMFGGGSMGTTAAAASGNTAAEAGVTSTIKEDMMASTAAWVSNTFGPEAAAALFTKNVDTGATELGGSIGGPASAVMTAYMYYQAAVIAIQIAYKCTDEEFELNVKRVLLSTHFVGGYCANSILGQCVEKRETYCQFSSPLSRIMNEQLRPTIGRDFGTPQVPNCDGLSLNDMATVDWSQVDLSEWEALLYDNGILPQASDITMESVTGAGNEMNIYGDRDNTLERVTDRLNTSDPEQVRQNIRTDAWSYP